MTYDELPPALLAACNRTLEAVKSAVVAAYAVGKADGMNRAIDIIQPTKIVKATYSNEPTLQ